MWSSFVDYLESVDKAVLAGWIGVIGALIGGFFGGVVGAKGALKSVEKAAEHERLRRRAELVAGLLTEVQQLVSGPMRVLQQTNSAAQDKCDAIQDIADRRWTGRGMLNNLISEGLINKDLAAIGQSWFNGLDLTVADEQYVGERHSLGDKLITALEQVPTGKPDR